MEWKYIQHGWTISSFETIEEPVITPGSAEITYFVWRLSRCGVRYEYLWNVYFFFNLFFILPFANLRRVPSSCYVGKLGFQCFKCLVDSFTSSILHPFNDWSDRQLVQHRPLLKTRRVVSRSGTPIQPSNKSYRVTYSYFQLLQVVFKYHERRRHAVLC
jgi:hypothetical protein